MNQHTPFQRFKALLPLLLPSDVMPENERFVKFLSEGNWISFAEQSHLAAAFFVALRDRKLLDRLSPQAKVKLQTAYQGNIARQIILCRLLTRILDALQSLAAPSILLKGLAYAYALYPDPNARIVGDIDLLIAPEERENALNQLTHQGFKRIHPPLAQGGEIAALARSLRLGWFYDRLITQRKKPVEESATSFIAHIGGKEELIEIHHRLIGFLPESIRGKIFSAQAPFYGRTRTLFLECGEVRVLDYDMAFLHAIRHLALHHRFIGFRWHYDIALMLLKWREYLKPEHLLQQAQELGSSKIVRVELALLHELFGPGIFQAGDRERWLIDPLPFEYPMYRKVAFGEKQRLLWKLVKPLLAPSLKEQIIALFY